MALRTGLTLREPTSKQLHLNVYSATRKRAERHLSRLWNGKQGCRKAGKSRLAKPVSDVPMDIDGATAPLVRNADFHVSNDGRDRPQNAMKKVPAELS